MKAELKLEELRMGNMFLYAGHSVHHVNQFFWHTVLFDKSYIERCSPISLTEDWLLKLGFHRNENAEDHSFDDWRLPGCRIMIGDFNDTGYLLDQYDSMPPMKYVHQLQNLIHALTGSDLTLKE